MHEVHVDVRGEAPTDKEGGNNGRRMEAVKEDERHRKCRDSERVCLFCTAASENR